VLVALATYVGDTLPSQEGEVTLNAGFDCTVAEVPEFLSVLLTIEDGRPKRRSIELTRDGGKTFK
jgi:hypothetical protein